ncbi:hypothetical protein PABG_12489 [Paracoccidioides brasiliensis Pb03]|nr:hypothetical protein PABG_12489 [Paracoccidioides brasiliensis Pb03]
MDAKHQNRLDLCPEENFFRGGWEMFRVATCIGIIVDTARSRKRNKALNIYIRSAIVDLDLEARKIRNIRKIMRALEANSEWPHLSDGAITTA